MIFSNISSIDPAKGLIDFIAAVEMLDNKENLFFEIVGKASEVNEPFEKKLRQTIVEKELGAFVGMKGFIADIKAYLETVDAVVLTSVTEEALPTVLIESIARGKTIIATDVGGVREIVEVGYGNIIVPPNDPKALKEALKMTAAYSPQKLKSIGETNISLAKERFLLRSQLDAMERLYLELCRK